MTDLFLHSKCQLPYALLTPLQAAVSVVQKVLVFLYKYETMNFSFCANEDILFITIFSESATYNPKAYSPNIRRTAWEMLAAGPNSKT